MANFVALEALIHAIASAVTGAQQEVEKAAIANLASYLDRENRPLTLQMRVPSLRPDAGPGAEDHYHAPLLALVPHGMLRIKQAEISFDIELGDLTDSAPEPKGKTEPKDKRPVSAPAANVLAAQVKKSLNVNPVVNAKVNQQGTSAHIVLTIEGVEPPEGLSRLVMEMIRTQGVTGSATKDSKSQQ